MKGYGKIIYLLLTVMISAPLHNSTAAVAMHFPTDTVKSDKKVFRLKEQIVPGVLIISGLALSGQDTKEKLQDLFPRTDTRIDNWLQWAPDAIMYTADIFTDKHKNNVFNQTKYAIFSQLSTAAIVQILKKATHVTRPNGGTLSFPSGHTSNAFAGATVLFREYRDYNKVIAYSGYLFSTATGVLRVTNNRHWVPDVLVGAGIGMVVTNLIYYFEPLKNWDPFRLSKKDKVVLIPEIDPDNNSYCLTVRIKL
jgi:membrane-associated phospholipid phosphatase